jgi:ATPase
LEEKPSKQFLLNLINQFYKEVEQRSDCFLEIDRNFSKVLQLGPYRTVVVMPPLSDGIEITVVRPVKKLSIDDYNLDEKTLSLFEDRAK